MPYARNSDLPANVKNVLPGSAQSIWRNVFNSTEENGDSENASRQQAWGAVKNAGYKRNADTGKWTKVNKAWGDAPNYQLAEGQSINCENCRFGQEDDFCELYDFTYDPDWVCDSWEAMDDTMTINKQKYGNKRNRRKKKNPDDTDKVFKASCEVTGVDESLGIVFGWGMITKINGEDYFDLDEQHVTNQFMLKATSSFMEESRISNDMHTESDIGVVVHSFPLTDEVAKSMGIFSNINGWMVGVKPSEDILAKFVSGEYTGFSIEGSAEWINVED